MQYSLSAKPVIREMYLVFSRTPQSYVYNVIRHVWADGGSSRWWVECTDSFDRQETLKDNRGNIVYFATKEDAVLALNGA